MKEYSSKEAVDYLNEIVDFREIKRHNISDFYTKGQLRNPIVRRGKNNSKAHFWRERELDLCAFRLKKKRSKIDYKQLFDKAFSLMRVPRGTLKVNN